MRNFDPMQNAQEECGIRAKKRDLSLDSGYGTGTASTEWALPFTPHYLATPLSTPVPAFLFCILHRVESPYSSLLPHPASIWSLDANCAPHHWPFGALPLDTNQTVARVFTTKGTFGYRCTLLPEMIATVVVH
jgi:hypothetical protein